MTIIIYSLSERLDIALNYGVENQKMTLTDSII